MRIAASLLAATSLALAPAVAADHHKDMKKASESELIKRSGDGVEMTDRAISGQELLNADLTRSIEPVGSVEEIVLDDNGKIAFVKYETSRFRDLDGGGYMAAGDMKLTPDDNFDIDVEVNNISSDDAPTRMTFDQSEADQRFLSNILRSEIKTERGTMDIRDVVFDPSGQIEYMVVGQGGGFLSQGDAYAIPYNRVKYQEGLWQTTASGEEMPMILFVASVD